MLRSVPLRRLVRRAAWPTVLASLFLAAPAYANVDPETVTTTLDPGGSIPVHKTVTTPAIPPKPDIFFLADTTGSMAQAIGDVRTGATNIMNLVRGVQPDSQFGVGNYRDENCSDPYVYKLDQAVTASIADAQAAINSWVTGNGCDTPEAQIYALYRVATDAATGFRSGSSPIVVWFGDQPGHDPSVGIGLPAAISALQSAGIRVIAISTGANQLNAGGQATAVTGATGGVFRSGVDDNAVKEAIVSALQNLPVTVTPQIVCDPGLSVVLTATSPESITSGGDVTYDETITVDPASPGGVTLSCTVTFLLNGLSQPGFVETITVTVNGADVAITKTGPATVTEGHNLTWTLTARNNGPATATAVTVSDPLPANTTFVSASAGCSFAAGTVTCAAGTLAPGQTKVFTVTALAGSAGGSITNTAGVAAAQSDPVPGNNHATAVTALNHNPVCTAVAASPINLWPPNHKLVPVVLSGATDADGDALTWAVTGVTQDEPTNGLGDGDTAIDAVLGSGPNLLVRAERSGTGDGRVYRIATTVTDGHGGSCTAVAVVGVPHDQSPARSVPVDSGGVFNSLI
jgi:uncharacterized repeat protein (TIGR01451 family)